MLVRQLLVAPQPDIRVSFLVLRSAMVYDEEEQVVLRGQLLRQSDKRLTQRLLCGGIVYVGLSVAVEVCGRRLDETRNK